MPQMGGTKFSNQRLANADTARVFYLAFFVVLPMFSWISRPSHSDIGSLLLALNNNNNNNNNSNNATAEQIIQRQELEPAARPVYFLNRTHQLSKQDGFSASWLQRVEDFMTQGIDRVVSCEGASFSAFAGRREPKLRMTVDWTDFCVEHLSKWWKSAKIFAHDIVYQSTIRHFDDFVEKATGTLDSTAPLPLLHPTIAVIAFQPYQNGHHKEEAWHLTVTSLAVTLESLRRVGFGRVVVVSMDEDDYTPIVCDSFQYLLDKLEGRATTAGFPPSTSQQQSTAVSAKNPPVTKIGTMEVAYAGVPAGPAASRKVKKNIPKASLLGLREAFRIHQNNAAPSNTTHVQMLQTWFGDMGGSYWKYVYLTEPDTILSFRSRSIPQLKATVDNGNVLVPHRLQPIPHESDMRGLNSDTFLKENDGFETVLQLDHHAEDACCDEFTGPTSDGRPGPGDFERCGNFWWTCGFVVKDDTDPHKRLRPYKLFRLTQGTGIVSLAGNEHGRRCAPTQNAECVVPEEYKLEI